jgi:putative membrane protein
MRLVSRQIIIPACLVAVSALGTTTPRVAAAQNSRLNDPTIVAIFDAANTYDMETGQLAVSHSRSNEIREFGRMLVRDHRSVRAQGRDLARSLRVTPTPPRNFAMARDHARAMRQLSALRGRAFDRAFLQHEVDYHNAVIDAVTNTLLPAIQNARLKDLVTKVAPAFVAHRDKAQSLLNGLK